jgi:hypothetical protein
MKKTLTLAACLAALACFSGQAPGQFDPPGWRQPQFPGAGDPWNRPGLPGQNLGPGGRPGLGDPWNRPGLPGQNFGPGGRPNPARDEDKDRPWQPGIEALRHLPHVAPHVFPPGTEVQRPPVSEFKPAVNEFKSSATRFKPAVSEVSQVRSSWWKGGGLLAGIGAAIAGVFRGLFSLFGRKKDEESA